MNGNTEGASLQLSTAESGESRETNDYLHSIAGSHHDNTHDAVALFPAGRFFRFPVLVKLRIARECFAADSSSPSICSDLNLKPDQLHEELGPVLWASIENANCLEMARPLPEIFLFRDVVLDFRKMELRRGGRQIHATAHELKTLHYFVTHPEVPISREELLNRVWGFHHYPTTRTVDNRIMHLRQKIESDPSRPIHFLTVRGVGYKFVP